MKILAIARKEFQDLIREKVYIVAFFVQLFLVVGIVFVAYLYTSIATPEAVERYIPAQQVKIGTNVPVEIPQLKVVKANTLREALSMGCVAFLKFPPDFKDRLENLDKVEVTLVLDNTNLLSSYANAKITQALAEMERRVIERRAKERGVELPEVEVIAPSEEEQMGEFVQLMYGILIPFILLLPTFIASNMTTDLIVGEKERRTYELLICSPATRLEIVLGKALPVIFICTAESFLWIKVIELRGLPIYNEPLLILYMALLNLTFFSFGIGISAVSESVKDANSAVTFLLILASFAIFAPVALRSGVQSLSPATVISNLASNPEPWGIGMPIALTLAAGVLTLFLSVKLMERIETLRV